MIFSSRLRTLLAFLCLVAGAVPVHVCAQELIRLEVRDAYVDLRTGPGDEFPIVQVAGRHEVLTVLLRHAQWVKVRNERGFEAWVSAAQLSASDPEGLVTSTWRDHVARQVATGRIAYGLSWGYYDRQPQEAVSMAFRSPSGLTAELAFGEGNGQATGLTYWKSVALIQPFDWHGLAPGIGLGLSRSQYQARSTASSVALAGTTQALLQLELRYAFSRDWLIRFDWTDASRFRTPGEGAKLQAVTAGLSFQF